MFSWMQAATVALSMTMGPLLPAKESTTISSTFRSLRPSPPLKRKRASVSRSSIGFSLRMTSSRKALSSNCLRSATSSDFSTNTWQRDRRGVMTSKEGFSVVAPMRMTVPASTAPRRASCWALLKRWISSMKRMGAPLAEAKTLPPRARSMTSRTSLTPADTAESV